MKRILFVSNGHGEAAIADRIAAEIGRAMPDAQLDHLALVGEPRSAALRAVGPRRAMPSGGLIAMGNLRNIARDVRAGLLPLLAAQERFLRSSRGSYDAVVAVGDAFALAMALRARSRTVFVGTAKSVSVARYGRLEERLLARARARFVRDEPTARALRAHGLDAEGANAIYDLFLSGDDPDADAAVDAFAPALALLPGSRESAYDDGLFLLSVLRELAAVQSKAGGVLSVAGGLDPQRFAEGARQAGWDVHAHAGQQIPFVLCAHGRVVARAWTGALGPLFRRVTLVLGQAGTANEGAAAAGVGVVAFAREQDGRSRWYRRRQQGLLGDALLVLPADLGAAAAGVARILNDTAARKRMGETGRERMAGAGAVVRIASAIEMLAQES